MNENTNRRRLLATGTLLAMAAGLPARAALAHDFRAGDLTIDHPYAMPTPPGTTTGAVYFRGIRNRGRQADRLVGASTAIAARVEIHETVMTGDVARMRETDGIALPAGQTVQIRHGQRFHLMLIGLKQPLVVGERFDIALRFERNGEQKVQAWVQQPRSRGGAADHDGHRH